MKLHVAFLAPPLAPRVADDPVVAWYIDAHDIDGVIDVGCSHAAGVDAASVGAPVSGVNNNRERSSSEDVLNHGLLPSHNRELIYDCDNEGFLVVVACGGWDVVRVEIIVRDAASVANVVIRGLWPTS